MDSLDSRIKSLEIWIGFVGVLAGALVGGLVTYAVAHDQISATAQATAEQRHAAALGTARLMREEFDAWARLMKNRIEQGRYAKARLRLTTELDPPTRLVVAGAVDPGVWEKVARATSLAPLAARLANRHGSEEKLRDGDARRAVQYKSIFEMASAALRPLAEESP
jgi:hypothetical protein